MKWVVQYRYNEVSISEDIGRDNLVREYKGAGFLLQRRRERSVKQVYVDGKLVVLLKTLSSEKPPLEIQNHSTARRDKVEECILLLKEPFR